MTKKQEKYKKKLQCVCISRDTWNRATRKLRNQKKILKKINPLPLNINFRDRTQIVDGIDLVYLLLFLSCFNRNYFFEGSLFESKRLASL